MNALLRERWRDYLIRHADTSLLAYGHVDDVIRYDFPDFLLDIPDWKVDQLIDLNVSARGAKKTTTNNNMKARES